jgi:hypothetical protein
MPLLYLAKGHVAAAIVVSAAAAAAVEAVGCSLRDAYSVWALL